MGTLTGAVGELHNVIQIYITYKYLIVSETKLKFMVKNIIVSFTMV